MDRLSRQNEMKSLRVQTTARLLYNKADTIDTIQWLVVLSLPVFKIIFLQSIILNYVMIVLFFLSFALDYWIDKYTDIAAELKKSFDFYVYGWTTDYQDKLLDLSKTYEARNKAFYLEQISNSGTDEVKGVKDWYTTVDKNMSQEEFIKSAMKENIYFDKRINNIAFWLIVIFVALTIFALAISGLTFYEVLLGFFVTFASLSKKIYLTLVNLKKVSIINLNIESLLCSRSINLIYLQSEIDKKRSIPRTSNKLIYNFQTKQIHEEVSVFKSRK
ncbi:hypothetical protein HCA55_02105 [Listeria booriae]|uniref:Uncharacterized protein n=1 Tax=Listeria booriae TaxID=1552123 RepID=A0A842B138_9LIST|nr:S-4TM family putative pore-forming effector [Listeria booriae]MBC1400348.1 hypothetical protein [Listeria booriae]MBC1614593.1 hypothetical protein [Listeria booriae]MBC1795495.1 hypothetical protein [Listeria booriae]